MTPRSSNVSENGSDGELQQRIFVITLRPQRQAEKQVLPLQVPSVVQLSEQRLPGRFQVVPEIVDKTKTT